jgi:hypothetical protein
MSTPRSGPDRKNHCQQICLKAYSETCSFCELTNNGEGQLKPLRMRTAIVSGGETDNRDHRELRGGHEGSSEDVHALL